MTGTIKSPQALIFFIPPFSKFETESCPTPPERGGGWYCEGFVRYTFWDQLWTDRGTYLDPRRTFLVDFYAKIVDGWKLLNISKYASGFVDISMETFEKVFLVPEFSLPLELVKKQILLK